MKKRLLSFIMTLSVIISLFTVLAPAAQAATGDFSSLGVPGITWSLDTVTGRLDISGPSGGAAMPNMDGTNAPWHANRTVIRNVFFNGFVTSIGNYAFSGCENLTAVTAPGVLSIGSYAFNGCVNLTGVHAVNATIIGEYAFNNCTALSSLNMTVSMSSVVNIGAYAFAGCRNITAITLPGGLTNIGTGAFTGCRFSTITMAGNSRFRVDAASGILYGIQSGNVIRVIKAPIGLSAAYTGIPGTVRTIDPEAFAHSDLVSITIPGGVSSIGANAFSWSPRLVEAIFEGAAPVNAPVAIGQTGASRQLFETVAAGFTIYYNPGFGGWSANWRGYTTVALSSYITINNGYELSMASGSSLQLLATVHPVNTNQTVTWEIVRSSAPDVATFTSAAGMIRALNTGWVEVRAVSTFIGVGTSTSVRSPVCRIYLVENIIPVTSVQVSPKSLTVVMGYPELLTAVVYPLTPEPATDQALTWTSSNVNIAYPVEIPGGPANQRMIMPVAPGTVTITVESANGRRDTCTVVVVADQSLIFTPVTHVTLGTMTVSMGADNFDLGAVVHPANASVRNPGPMEVVWTIIPEVSTLSATALTLSTITGLTGVLTVPWGENGTLVVDMTVRNGLMPEPQGVDYTQRFVINIVSFINVTEILPPTEKIFESIPVQLRAEIIPLNATYRNIKWSLAGWNGDPARPPYLDPDTGMLTAQTTGFVTVRATISNAVASGVWPIISTRDFAREFELQVHRYDPNELTLFANPGGTVSRAGSGLLANGQFATITALPNTGFMFSGWETTDGGTFDDPLSATTRFEMPDNDTTVRANFTYIGVSGGDDGNWTGGVVLPTPTNYFINGITYLIDSGSSFGHMTVRDFHLFSSLQVDGETLVRNTHYTASRSVPGGYTEIIFTNGYLDRLSTGQHTLTVNFSDRVSVSAVFAVYTRSTSSRLYIDVRTTDWFFDNVNFVSARGWMAAAQPDDPTRFRPHIPVTQGDVVEAIYKMVGSPSIIDQSGQTLYGREAAAEWVIANGLLPVAGAFDYESYIARQDVAVLMIRVIGIMRINLGTIRSAPSFTDDWQTAVNARAPISDLYRAGVLNGRSPTIFDPLGLMSRAEYAAVLHRFIDAAGR